MLKVVGTPGYETAINQTVGVPLPVEWVTITNPDPLPVSVVVVRPDAVGGVRRGPGGRWRALPAARGLLVRPAKIYFISTNGGNMGFGQVWMYDLAAETITLVVESSGHDMFDGPDNCCVSPRGGVVFCEDAAAAQHVRAVSPVGEVFDLARNLRNTIEFAGACFSPDGDTLFVNLYGRGNERTTQPYRSPVQIPVGPEKYERSATVAIWGPWSSGPL